MVSHYSNGLYDDLYNGWHRHEYQSFKGSHKSEGEEKPKTNEVLYINFEPVKTRGLFNENILV
jgi:DNA adenine methylase